MRSALSLPGIAPTSDAPILGLTLWRPWGASIFGWTRANGVLVPGPKRIENRPWPAPARLIGQRVAFHEGKTWDRGGVETMRRLGFEPPMPEEWPSGVIVGVARIVDCVDVESATASIVSTYGCIGGDEGAGGENDELETLLDDPYCFGPFAWVLDERVRLATPVPCKGAQGLWRLPADVDAAVRGQIGRETTCR